MTLYHYDPPVDALVGAVSPVGVAGHVAGEDVITEEVAEVQVPPGYSAQAQADAQHLLLSSGCLILSVGPLRTELEAGL